MNVPDKSTPRIRGTTPPVEAAAREHRRNMTPAERCLWAALRGNRLGGLHFRRQHPLGPFIADFYCAAHRLIIEVDGAVHATQQEYDDARTQQLASYGYHVLRFSNQQVLHSLPSVLERITPSPNAERG